MNKKLKHHDLIVKWANGATIEWYSRSEKKWVKTREGCIPPWLHPDVKFREEKQMLVEIRICAGWYKRSRTEESAEITMLLQGTEDEASNSESLRKRVASLMGYSYPDEIDFAYFDRSTGA